MLQKLCPKCRCIISVGKNYCESCQRAVDKTNEERAAMQRGKYNQSYDKKRNPKYRTFYNSAAWRTLSHAKMIAAGYQCEQCGKTGVISLAQEVHHLQPIQTEAGWSRRLDMDNLVCVCAACHNRLHGRFGGRGRKKVSDVSGTPLPGDDFPVKSP